jgi:hypothetical protein
MDLLQQTYLASGKDQKQQRIKMEELTAKQEEDMIEQGIEEAKEKRESLFQKWEYNLGELMTTEEVENAEEETSN